MLEWLLTWPFNRFSKGILGQFGVLLKKEMRLQWISLMGARVFCGVTFGLALWLCAVHFFAYRWFRMYATPKSLAFQVPVLAFLIFLGAFLGRLFC